MKFIKFFANVIADQNGDASSKRVITFILVYFLFLIVKGSLAGKPIDQNVLFIVGGLIAFGVGAITTEFISFVASKGGEVKSDEQLNKE